MATREERSARYDFLTIEPQVYRESVGGHPSGYVVYGHGTYEAYSVLAGQPMRVYLEPFDTVEDARAAYPTAQVLDWSTHVEQDVSPVAPAWFDEGDAGERWDEDY